jgi:hypothetical protein
MRMRQVCTGTPVSALQAHSQETSGEGKEKDAASVYGYGYGYTGQCTTSKQSGNEWKAQPLRPSSQPLRPSSNSSTASVMGTPVHYEQTVRERSEGPASRRLSSTKML